MFHLFRKPAPAAPASDLLPPAYRLRAWPELPDRLRTAAVYQAFSRMCQGPVSLGWFVDRSRMPPEAARNLFDFLVSQGDLEEIDVARFAVTEARGESRMATPEFA